MEDPFKKLWFEYLNIPKNEVGFTLLYSLDVEQVERLSKWGIKVADDTDTASSIADCDPKTACIGESKTPTADTVESVIPRLCISFEIIPV